MMAKKPLAPPRPRVMIVDDHEVVRAGLAAVLPDHGFEVVAAVGTAAEALAIAETTQPSIAVVDLRLPDMPGDALCESLRQRLPDIELVVLTTYMSEETVRASLRAGATAYVTKAAGIPELLRVLDRLTSGQDIGEVASAPQIVKKLHEIAAARMGGVALTPQQESVLELAAQGLTNREIGLRMFISESTVRFHLHKLKVKYSARNKADLIAIGIRTGAISPAEEDVSAKRD